MQHRNIRARVLVGLLVFGFTVTPGFSKDKNKNRDWQTGKLVSIEEGIPKSGGGMILPGTNPPMIMDLGSNTWIYTIETETMSYGLSFPSKHPLSLPINSQVKFALEPKGEAFLLDEKGKEVKGTLAKSSQIVRTQEVGVVALRSVPEGADVFVDGEFVGNSPATLKLHPGKHSVRVGAKGYKDWSRDLTVLPGSDVKLTAELERLPT